MHKVIELRILYLGTPVVPTTVRNEDSSNLARFCVTPPVSSHVIQIFARISIDIL